MSPCSPVPLEADTFQKKNLKTFHITKYAEQAEIPDVFMEAEIPHTHRAIPSLKLSLSLIQFLFSLNA